MDNFTYLNNANPAFLDDLYEQYKENPDSVDASWQGFFKGYDFAQHEDSSSSSISDKEVNVIKLIHAFRSRGHLISDTNPVRERRKHKADLTLDYFNLSEKDLAKTYEASKEIQLKKTSLKDILAHLKKTYCNKIGVEYMYCSNEHLRQWLNKEMESTGNSPVYTQSKKTDILQNLAKSVIFENFLQTKYIGKKRFSLEGLEGLIPALDQGIRLAAELGVKEFVLGMAHRGRLNVLSNIFKKSYEDVFSEFEDNIEFDATRTSGDVKYHLGKSADITTPEGHPIHLSLVPNPSHLEAVSPVMQGMVYAKRMDRYDGNVSNILPIVIHGDAALSGQGVNYEVANFAHIDGYDNGGTIHIVLNNQVGFTANYKESRSSIYCTDLAKVTEAPVFHVNADDPEAIVHAMEMAIKIRQMFHQDVYIDILGYRRYGHNEGDEPRFTQPLLYKTISKHPNVYTLFLSKLVNEKSITQQEAVDHEKSFKELLQKQLDDAKNSPEKNVPDMFKSDWKGFRLSQESDFESSIETGVSLQTLKKVMKTITTFPKDFNVFSKTKKIITSRDTLFNKNKKVDWALAEALAFGTLLTEKHSVRISGQDSQRGTFSHRHSVIKDVENEATYTPLNHIQKNQSKFYAYNSLLSEYGVLAFEYGYSLSRPQSLTIWEAQFGDFSNGSQIVMDQFISSSEQKWNRVSGLVMLLPHGYEGQGPEHSSARFERYLQLCGENNMYICNITDPANFFHVLRRQVHNAFRIPLVIMSPKSLLRHPAAISDVSALTTGSFKEILDDEKVTASSVKKVLLCTGKIYYELLEARPEKDTSTAIVRLEQLYPSPKKQMAALRKKYKKATQWIWVQEEPENMGAWSFMLQHYRDWNLDVIARPASASPATGSNKLHIKNQAALIKRAFKN